MQGKSLHTSYSLKMGRRVTPLPSLFSPSSSPLHLSPLLQDFLHQEWLTALFSQYFLKKINSELYIRVKTILSNVLGRRGCWVQPGGKSGRGWWLVLAYTEPRAVEIWQLPHPPKGCFQQHKVMKGPQFRIIPIHSMKWNHTHRALIKSHASSHYKKNAQKKKKE